MRDEVPLFWQHDLTEVMQGRQTSLLAEAQAYPSNTVLSTPTHDLASRLAKKYQIDVPVLDVAGQHVSHQEREIETDPRGGGYGHYSDRYGPHKVTGTEITLTIPFSGDKIMFRVRPHTYDTSPPRAEIGHGSLTIRVHGQHLHPDRVRRSLDDTVKGLQTYLGWLRETVDPFNEGLVAAASVAIEQRKTKLLADQNLVAGLGFPLKARPDAPKTYVAPQVRQRIEPTSRTPTSAPFKPEPVLDEKNYQRILSIIENMTHVMERSPTAFATLGEEDLRQHFLVQLNGQFEGQATGETFNFNGKTDILIRVDDRNIFIGECKFWRGEKVFLETVDQVLGYLSWRDTKAAILLFNRNKGFSEVVAKAEAAMVAHPHFKRGPTKVGETHSRWTLGNPGDHNREIILTLMAFDVPAKA